MEAHDIGAVLSHFAQDVVLTSPVATRFLDGSDGVLRGKTALREYWTRGLELIPGLRFADRTTTWPGCRRTVTVAR